MPKSVILKDLTKGTSGNVVDNHCCHTNDDEMFHNIQDRLDRYQARVLDLCSHSYQLDLENQKFANELEDIKRQIDAKK